MNTYPEEFSRLEEENKRLKNIIIEAKICAATLCIAEMPSLKGLKEIASILNQGINEGDVRKALFDQEQTKYCICCEENAHLHRNCGK